MPRQRKKHLANLEARVALTTKSSLNMLDIQKTMSVLESFLPRLTELSLFVEHSADVQANKCDSHTCSGTYDKGNPVPEPGDDCPGHSYCEAESCRSHSCTGHNCDEHSCDTHACSTENFTGGAVIPFAQATSARWYQIVEGLDQVETWSGITLHVSQDVEL